MSTSEASISSSGILHSSIVKSVRALYELHPYPHYPLFAKPRWQDGYLTHSHFANRLICDLGIVNTPAYASVIEGSVSTKVLIGGGGEILPYIIRKWESKSQSIVTVDLSSASLKRARWRCKWYPRSIQFEHADLDHYLRINSGQQDFGCRFRHIDVYGVLHHMANPTQTLKLIGEALVPGGTVRLMVYNSAARSWIHELQRTFYLLGIDPASADDINMALRILRILASKSIVIAGRLRQMGLATLNSPARFADTFLHPREARIGIAAWYKAIVDAGLKVAGLFDRYAELDDLANPLWQAPNIYELEPRLIDRRFENNFELFLVRPTEAGVRSSALMAKVQHPRMNPWLLMLKAPPSQWFSYLETKQIDLPMRLRIWHAHLRWVMNASHAGMSTVLSSLPMTALQRLVRIGAICLVRSVIWVAGQVCVVLL